MLGRLILGPHERRVSEAEISIATKAWAPAPASDPLTLILTAERSECTAGTLNSVSWEIRGGVEPYRDLLVGGAPVEADAESATFTCGALPEGASAARGTVWVSVRDATNRLELAGASYTIVPPPPPPTCFDYGVGPTICTRPARPAHP